MRRDLDPFEERKSRATIGIGQPGYRTREGRSGYDPLETQQEAGYIVGVLLKKLFDRLRRWHKRHR